jgi:oligopeptide transport system substrate-binding protein
MKAALTDPLTKSAVPQSVGAAAAWPNGTHRSQGAPGRSWSASYNLIARYLAEKVLAWSFPCAVSSGDAGTRERYGRSKQFPSLPRCSLLPMRSSATPFGFSRCALHQRVVKAFLKYLPALPVILVSACSGNPWNSPYPADDADKNVLYSAFAERPKHLDPVQSYSSNEILFTAQIYEPPLQYHYLKRPYELIPSAAAKMPAVQYFDQDGERLADDANPAQIAYTVYEISIKPGIRYQPHPAFARNEGGEFLYHSLSAKDLAGVYKLSDFPHDGSRELTAHDYVFQIKRLAHPKLHSPILGLMSDYIVGLKNYSAMLRTAAGRAQSGQENTNA